MLDEPSHQQKRYVNGSSHDDPFFAPEEKSTRTKRLSNQLDSIISSIHFPQKPARETRAVRSPSHELLLHLDPPTYIAGEKSKMQKKRRMAEMDHALTHVRGSSKHGKKGKKAMKYADDHS